MPTLDSIMKATASGLAAERARLEIAVSNLANAESTRGADGKPYRRRDVVLESDPVDSFDAILGRATATGVKVSAGVTGITTGSTAGAIAPGATSGADFGATLTRVLSAVDTTAGDANVAVDKMLTGGGDIFEAMIALHKAEETFQVTVQMRNKFMQ